MSRNPGNRSVFAGAPVAPREGRVSRNWQWDYGQKLRIVAPREGRVSRNQEEVREASETAVAPRKGRVSRNLRFILARYLDRVASYEELVNKNFCISLTACTFNARI